MLNALAERENSVSTQRLDDTTIIGAETLLNITSDSG